MLDDKHDSCLNSLHQLEEMFLSSLKDLMSTRRSREHLNTREHVVDKKNGKSDGIVDASASCGGDPVRLEKSNRDAEDSENHKKFERRVELQK